MVKQLSQSDEKISRLNIIQELFKPARRHYRRSKVQVKGLNDLAMCDIAIFTNLASENKSYKYLLLCVNALSKQLYGKKMKTRSAQEVTENMEKIILEMPRVRLVQTDEEKAFTGKLFSNLMKKYNMHRYHTFSKIKASMIERAIRTFRTALAKQMHFRGNHNWIDIYQNTLNDYNNTWHNTIRMKPNEVTLENSQLLLDTVFKPKTNTNQKPKFRVGQIVRVNLNHNMFSKLSSSIQWSTSLFRVKSYRTRYPAHTYTLENLDSSPVLGTFYAEELSATKYPDVYLVEKVLRKKRGKAFVRWLGMTDSENSWIDL
jgi:hypothetical protein